MKTRIIIFLLLFISKSGFSQNSLPGFKQTKDSLIKIESDLVLDYHLSYGGMLVPEIEKDCSEIEPRYLFWISNGQYYKQKFTECKKYPEVEINKSELLSTVLDNLKEIQQTEIKPVQSENIVQIEVVHEDIWHFNIYTPKISFKKSISRFELETENIDAKEKNINYKFNQNSILNRLIKLAQKEAY